MPSNGKTSWRQNQPWLSTTMHPICNFEFHNMFTEGRGNERVSNMTTMIEDTNKKGVYVCVERGYSMWKLVYETPRVCLYSLVCLCWCRGTRLDLADSANCIPSCRAETLSRIGELQHATVHVITVLLLSVAFFLVFGGVGGREHVTYSACVCVYKRHRCAPFHPPHQKKPHADHTITFTHINKIIDPEKKNQQNLRITAHV